MRHVWPAFISALVVSGIVVAASGASADEDPATLIQQLTSSYGGQTETDEQPAFGDADLAAAEFQADDPRFKDPVKLRGELQRAEQLFVLLMWGYLRPHPDATEVVDWTGNISVSNAGLRVLRTLTFEEDGVVVRPRTDPAVVEFESQTKPHADGLLLDVVLAPELNPSGGPVTLSLNTAPFTATLTLEPDMRRSAVEKVDDAGHVVAYQIIRPDRDGCAEGFVRGIWRAKETADGREVGVIKGLFTADEGRLRGHLRGVFGVRENGKQVWFAKVIDREGKFLGVVAGRWGEGKFAGLFLGPEGKVRGVIRSRYRDGDGDTDGGFLGRYSERCGEDVREGSRLDNDEPDVALDDDDR